MKGILVVNSCAHDPKPVLFLEDGLAMPEDHEPIPTHPWAAYQAPEECQGCDKEYPDHFAAQGECFLIGEDYWCRDCVRAGRHLRKETVTESGDEGPASRPPKGEAA
jgi:hypothetical protein